MSKSKLQIKKEFLHQVEFFYRNFGNEWTLNEFPDPVKNHIEYLLDYLPELEKAGIIELKEGGKFIIKDLPSNYPNLFNE